MNMEDSRKKFQNWCNRTYKVRSVDFGSRGAKRQSLDYMKNHKPYQTKGDNK